MKKFLLGAAAALAIAAPGAAAAQSGYVDLGYASTEAEVGGLDVEGDGWQLGGAAAWDGQGTVGVQLDAAVGEAEDVSNYSIGGHLFSRSDSYLFGGFANYGNVDPDGGADFDLWTVGFETQWYMNRTTLDGALSYSEAEDADATLTALDLGLTHFATDNLSFGGNVGVGELELLGVDADALSYGLGAEWQFASAPVSVFGGWQHADIDDFNSDADTLSIGVRYNWGGSLFERNRSGASLTRGGGLGRYGGLL
jgi:hypothetical protein